MPSESERKSFREIAKVAITKRPPDPPTEQEQRRERAKRVFEAFQADCTRQYDEGRIPDPIKAMEVALDAK